MMRTLFSCLLGLSLLCSPLLVVAPQKAHAQKDDPKGQVVKVKSVDPKASSLIVTTPEGKVLTFKIEDKIKIYGPLGGVSEDRLKDDRITAGSEITLYYTADNKTLKEIKLGYRKKGS